VVADLVSDHVGVGELAAAAVLALHAQKNEVSR
jgi:hypothetical protein